LDFSTSSREESIGCPLARNLLDLAKKSIRIETSDDASTRGDASEHGKVAAIVFISEEIRRGQDSTAF
jgi:hypothetical protein